jgi:hypothetical protein
MAGLILMEVLMKRPILFSALGSKKGIKIVNLMGSGYFG